MIGSASHPWNPEVQLVRNRRTGGEYRLVSALHVVPTEDQLKNIAVICNQTKVYDLLFRNRRRGAPYRMEDASGFLSWAHNGWQAQTHFVFLLIDSEELVVGALDIKSVDRKIAEVGYWCSEPHRGLISNALGSMLSLAREAGFSTFFAKVRQDNRASQMVLENNSFTQVGPCPDHPGMLRYERLPVGGVGPLNR